jgi:hypothetical protein
MAQDDLVHRGSSRYEWVVSPGAEGAHGRLLMVSIGDVPDTMNGPVLADRTVRLSYS